ncbi:GTPase required for pre-60S ribosomal subunit nuclear export and maturation [Ceratobasidium sp. 428]|nr:GTPase required for pre-60S ribosomal subunit nuclear export and maturation [Ceratobasidium sp. 428]
MPASLVLLHNLLGRFLALHSDEKRISVGSIGYPNVVVVNCLKEGRACRVATIPGETKVRQYTTIMGQIYLIDCSGTIVERPLNRQSSKRCHALARKSGKPLEGGESDWEAVAKTVLNGRIREKIQFSVAPPGGGPGWKDMEAEDEEGIVDEDGDEDTGRGEVDERSSEREEEIAWEHLDVEVATSQTSNGNARAEEELSDLDSAPRRIERGLTIDKVRLHDCSGGLIAHTEPRI